MPKFNIGCEKCPNPTYIRKKSGKVCCCLDDKLVDLIPAGAPCGPLEKSQMALREEAAAARVAIDPATANRR